MATEQTFGLDQTSISVFEARFGDKDGALALLEYPQDKRDFFLRLSDKADLPDSAPAGAAWEPFVRGWRQDDFYIVALTEADHTAVRPGMIATRMIAIGLTAIEKCDDLGTIFEILHRANRTYVPKFTVPLISTQLSRTVSPPLLACVAHHLIHEEQPAAVIGQGEFETLITALWLKLPPELRLTFRFGFSFTPVDLTVMLANVVAVPSSCEGRWSSYRFKCYANWSQPLSDSLAAFLSEAQAQGFLIFLKEVGLVFHSFSDYGRYARLWNYWQRREECDPEVIHALLRSLGTLLPEPDVAQSHKNAAMLIAAGLLKSGSEVDILALRSVKARAFPSQGALLEHAVCDWIKSRIQSPQADNCSALSKVIQALPLSQSAEWQGWVRKGLKREFTSLSNNAAQSIWMVWQVDGTFAEIGAQLPSDAMTESALSQTCPSDLSPKIFSTMEKWLVDRGWICLMAKVALPHRGFVKTADLVFNQKEGKAREAAIVLLSAAAKPSEIWSCAFNHNDPTLFRCAVAAAIATPTLWNSDVTDVNRWVSLFDLAARNKPHFLCTFDANAIRTKLFEAWEEGAPVTEAICDALEKAAMLEFTSYKDRSILWPKVPQRYLPTALSNTLQAWLKNYYSRPPSKPNLEKAMVGILFAPHHRDFTFPRASSYLGDGGLMLVEKWGGERECELWLNAVMAGPKELSSNTARRAGDIVAQRHWKNLAKIAKDGDERGGKHDLRPIWQTYYLSLGSLEKIAFDYLPSFSRRPPNLSTTINPTYMTDAVFVTALPEEFTAVREHLRDRHEHTEHGTIYEIGRFDTDKSQCTVAIVQTGMGNSLSAAATERALSFFKPKFAFFVGIAGGLRDDLKIGDVVAASKVYGYEGGKSGGVFQPRPDAPPVTHEAEQRANAVVRDNTWHKRINPLPQIMPSAVVRPIAAGEKVLVSESSEDLKRVRATYTDAYAVAMEDHGFATAVRGHQSVCFAVVRGISDLIENKKEADRSGSHEVAARNAAAFAFEMLAGLLRGRSSS